MSKQIREIRVIDLITYAGLPPLVVALLWPLPVRLLTPICPLAVDVIVYIAAALISYFALRRFLIGLVLLYKAFAPLHMRASCRFEPTCSTYMIMSIQKYGIIIGVFKGIRRLMRCKPPNGGVDYP